MTTWICRIPDNNNNLRFYAVVATTSKEATEKLQALIGGHYVRWTLELSGEDEPQHIYTSPTTTYDRWGKALRDIKSIIDTLYEETK